MASPTIDVLEPIRQVRRSDVGVPNERIAMILRSVVGSRILHVGCVGHNLPQSSIAETHCLHYQLCEIFGREDVVGLDIDRVSVEKMQGMGFRAYVGDAEDIEFRDCFHTVVAGELIEHLQNPGSFLLGCHRALKTGGRLVLSTPNVFSVMLNLMYLKNFDRAFNPEHALWFCPQTLAEILRRHDFIIEEREFVDDLQPELVASRFYRLFVAAWRVVRVFLPRRLRNTMVVVCTRRQDAENARQ